MGKNSAKIRCTTKAVEALLALGHTIDMTGAANPLRFGNKAYWCGNGWWRFNNKASNSLEKTRVAIKHSKYRNVVERRG